MKKKWNPEKVSAHASQMVVLRYTCPLCQLEGETTLVDPVIFGGCRGGHGEGEYCYCTYPHYEETVTCPCGVIIELETS